MDQTPQRHLANHDELNMQVEVALDNLGSKLLSNLEENSEINQTLKELKDLKVQNEIILNARIIDLEKSINNVEIFTRLSSEIVALKRVMENNEKIEAETNENLKKNLEEKKMLQEKILQVTQQNYQASQDNISYCQELEKNLEILNFERLGLWNQNVEIFNQAKSLAMEKMEKDQQILQMEKYIQEMQRKLGEKVSY